MVAELADPAVAPAVVGFDVGDERLARFWGCAPVPAGEPGVAWYRLAVVEDDGVHVYEATGDAT